MKNCKHICNYIVTLVLLICIGASSCKKFLKGEIDKSLVTTGQVFSNDITATAAVVGIYHDIQNFSALSGYSEGVNSLSGLSAHELSNYFQNPGMIEFESHNITTLNSSSKSLWDLCYNIIYRTNDILRALEDSSSVTVSTKQQLRGEALFVRAFCYFYLVNYFGGVPVITTTDYKTNSIASRVSPSMVYNQIIDDLVASEAFLTDTYITGEKVRPNKAAARALLARVYLYTERWLEAETESSGIIDRGEYQLTGLNEVFLANSGEAIWQMMPVVPYYCTIEGAYFIFDSSPQNHVLTNNVLEAFEQGDNRKTAWLDSSATADGTFYFPFKYKIASKEENAPFTEYSTVFRLAELHLIRAEARAHLNKLSEAIADVDTVRSRAGLTKISDSNPGISQNDLLLLIEHERQVELFTEGHRWLDLKRTGRALFVIGGGITEEDLLYPIPKIEFDRNPRLGDQNPGY